MPESVLIAIDEPTDVAQARRVASTMAKALGFSEVRTGEVAIVATEVSTNILKHASRGEVILRITGDEQSSAPELEMLALDQGPGMRDIDRCIADGYTTASSPGQGLGAVRRLSTESDFYSLPGEGTAILARWSSVAQQSCEEAGDKLRVGVVNLQKKGQVVCGDSWGIEQNDEITMILVADGLGHGHEANVASQEAVRILHNHPDTNPQALLQLSHQALRSTRGAAIAAVRVDRVHQQLTFAGVGNIMAQIYSGAKTNQHLVSVNGTAGHQVPRLREFSYPWPADGMLVLYSDGLATGTSMQHRPGLAFRDPTLIAGVLYRDFTRGLDDATVVVAKAATV